LRIQSCRRDAAVTGVSGELLGAVDELAHRVLVAEIGDLVIALGSGEFTGEDVCPNEGEARADPRHR
jgi:hypothetical protein